MDGLSTTQLMQIMDRNLKRLEIYWQIKKTRELGDENGMRKYSMEYLELGGPEEDLEDATGWDVSEIETLKKAFTGRKD